MITRTDEPSAADILAWLSVVDMKLHLRLVGTAQDDVVSEMILAAYSMLDGPGGKYQRAILGPQEYEISIPTFPAEGGEIVLAFAPLRDVISISYVDADGVTQEMDASEYTVTGSSIRPAVSPLVAWPSAKSVPNAVTVVFTAGWDADKIPYRIRQATKMLAAHFFENREATFIDNRSSDFVHEVPIGVKELIALDRVPNRYA